MPCTGGNSDPTWDKFSECSGGGRQGQMGPRGRDGPRGYPGPAGPPCDLSDVTLSNGVKLTCLLEAIEDLVPRVKDVPDLADKVSDVDDQLIVTSKPGITGAYRQREKGNGTFISETGESIVSGSDGKKGDVLSFATSNPVAGQYIEVRASGSVADSLRWSEVVVHSQIVTDSSPSRWEIVELGRVFEEDQLRAASGKTVEFRVTLRDSQGHRIGTSQDVQIYFPKVSGDIYEFYRQISFFGVFARIMQSAVSDMERRLGIMLSVVPVLEKAASIIDTRSKGILEGPDWEHIKDAVVLSIELDTKIEPILENGIKTMQKIIDERGLNWTLHRRGWPEGILLDEQQLGVELGFNQDSVLQYGLPVGPELSRSRVLAPTGQGRHHDKRFGNATKNVIDELAGESSPLYSGLSYVLRFLERNQDISNFMDKIDSCDSELRRLANNIQPSHGQETLEWPEGVEELFLNKNAPIDVIDEFVSNIVETGLKPDVKENVSNSWSDYKLDKSVANAKTFRASVLALDFVDDHDKMAELLDITTHPSMMIFTVLTDTDIDGSDGSGYPRTEVRRKIRGLYGMSINMADLCSRLEMLRYVERELVNLRKDYDAIQFDT